MAESLFRAWWDRLRGRLEPRPCPCSQAWCLEMPIRARRAGPKRIVGRFGLRPGERVLEIGPGTGFYSVEAARMVRPDGRLVCVDVQMEMLAVLRERLQNAGERAVVAQGDACKLPIRTGSVDHVFLITVLGEIPDRPAALEEIRRVLRPGGRLSVSEQFPDPDFVTLRALRHELSQAGFVEQASRGRLVYTSTWRIA